MCLVVPTGVGLFLLSQLCLHFVCGFVGMFWGWLCGFVWSVLCILCVVLACAWSLGGWLRFGFFYLSVLYFTLLGLSFSTQVCYSGYFVTHFTGLHGGAFVPAGSALLAPVQPWENRTWWWLWFKEPPIIDDLPSPILSCRDIFRLELGEIISCATAT